MWLRATPGSVPSFLVLQEAINTGTFMWCGVRHKCMVWIGGDLPWLKRLLWISVCPQVASLYNEGVCDPMEEVYKGWKIRRSDDTDAALHEMYTQDSRTLTIGVASRSPS